MAYEQKPGTGAIFKNEYKTTDNHPDYRGNLLTPSGETLDISLWVKKSQGGKSYFSLSLQEPYKKEAPKSDNLAAIETASAGETEQYSNGIADDLPF